MFSTLSCGGMAGSDCSVSLSSLLCQEEACFDDDEEEEEEENERFLSIEDLGLLETEDEYIEILVSKERSFGSESSGSSDDFSTENWLKCARLDAVRWILETRAFFGFSFQTAYLSIFYLDRFLSKRPIDSGKYWAIRLLSVACLSLAAKMEECRVPALSEFRTEDFEFENQVIQRMELLVLSTLDWRLSSVTPFAYLNYFISKLSEKSRPKTLVLRAMELILATTEVMDLVNHRPSAIAAAAVLVASDQSLPSTSGDFKMGVISLCGCLENKHVFSCYNLMRELEERKLNMHNLVASIYAIPANGDVLDD
ncbi:cyclin-D5-3-like isoform X2 [Magnolia sinica]|uniref:cyclin-D5-3-like isoform X2 n=1 Tax=Magnolia sinica TaxID=86752 RepID=UPI00265A2198|nr:cyclin-D5-3-like isoform X2 [Magnolia sinica]